MNIHFLETDFDKVSYLLNSLSSRATGMAADPSEFETLRHELFSNPNIAPLLPQWLRNHRTLDSFWGFIKPKFGTYAERRTYLSHRNEEHRKATIRATLPESAKMEDN